ncbi:hypothetical protein KUTeg_000058 [Tegillarca granosa]|uniref:Uncharacterized protein n=1 Tax=Tegillarca granosa TaxID=220873 RepID=A0ABQ9FXP0_TEGGR|nr:hypothetical protein KUTeg_000058 [Tegillarca granosa]
MLSIPVLFSKIGSFGRALCILFFFCLSFAGISSLIANLELVAHTLADFGIPRKFGMPLTVLFTFLIGLMSALDLDVLTNQDFVWGFALLLNGLMLQIMVISYGTSRFRAQVYNDYSLDDWIMPKFIAPIEAIAIIVWWAIDLIDKDAGDGENWYEFGRETLVVTIVQLSIVSTEVHE